jgi:RNA polymerase sigma factor (sigma-70 family)
LGYFSEQLVLKHKSMSRPVDLNDETIIQGIKTNDVKSLEGLYKAHYSMILRFVQNNNGTEQEAKDIYQEAIIVLYENIKDGKFELACKIKTYLYSICRRLWLKRLTEKRKYGEPLQESYEFIDVSLEMPAIEEKEMQFAHMTAALQKLGEPCKMLLEDFYINALSMVSISEKFGYTNPDNAKNQKYKCLMRLKKIFFSEYKK